MNSGLTASGLMPSTIVDDRMRGFRTYIVQIHYEKGQKEMKTFVLYVLNEDLCKKVFIKSKAII